MRTVDLIQKKRDGEELNAEQISYLVESTLRAITGLPDVGLSDGCLFSGMIDVNHALTDSIVRSGEMVTSLDPGQKWTSTPPAASAIRPVSSVAPFFLLLRAGVIVPKSRPSRGIPRHAGQAGIHPGCARTCRSTSSAPSARGGPVLHRTERAGPQPRQAVLSADERPRWNSIPLMPPPSCPKKLTVGSDALDWT